MTSKNKIAIIGAGISGLSVAQMLKNSCRVKVFESADRPGGLVKCDVIDGILYHKIGGHVFNSRRLDVLEWFWPFFDKNREFIKTKRNASVYLDKPIGYPIENNIFQLNPLQIKLVIKDLLEVYINNKTPSNFEEFLRYKFGNTLYEIYFKPYNEKIWKKELKSIPLSWLEGKLPMPSIEEIIYDNFCRKPEMEMVHSSFYYPLKGGSQFIVDRLADGLDVVYNYEIINIKYFNGVWILNDGHEFDRIIFTGNIKNLPNILNNHIISDIQATLIEKLEFHGTTSVLCQIEKNPYSWLYLPDNAYASHRIINTGNFSPNNNINNSMMQSCTVEFTDYFNKEDILLNLSKMPFSPKYISHFYAEYTYPIQYDKTRELINSIKAVLKPFNLFLLGRFAEWEYYNMDAAIGAAINYVKENSN